MKKILITGKSGQLGTQLEKTLKPLGEIFCLDRQSLNFEDLSIISQVISSIKPDVIVNAAAYTAVDRAETDENRAMTINGHAVHILAQEAKKINALLVHFSTDYVFEGSKITPYTEEDKTYPINVYGKSKLYGENAIKEVSDRFIILRTSGVYGQQGQNFLLTMLKLAKERSSLKIVGDQIGAPTWSFLIANKTALILKRYFDEELTSDLMGIYHLSSSGCVSWFDFAEAIFEFYESQGILPYPHFKKPNLQKISSEEYQSLAKRPKKALLSNEKIQKKLDIVMPDWKSSLISCLSSN